MHRISRCTYLDRGENMSRMPESEAVQVSTLRLRRLCKCNIASKFINELDLRPQRGVFISQNNDSLLKDWVLLRHDSWIKSIFLPDHSNCLSLEACANATGKRSVGEGFQPLISNNVIWPKWSIYRHWHDSYQSPVPLTWLILVYRTNSKFYNYTWQT